MTSREIPEINTTELVRSAIVRIAVGPDRGRDIERHEAEQIMQAILNGKVNDVQTAIFLIALRMKRESGEEFAGLFDALHGELNQTEVAVDELIQLADPFDGYVRHLPMSPFLPALLSACGLNVVMSGVETVGPKHGITAHKVYKAAGINTQMPALLAAQAVEKYGWAYVDQSDYFPALFAMSELRDTIVKRTAITTLERVLMPLRANNNTHLVLGYVHKAYPEIYSAAAKQAGFNSALLLKGLEGGLTPALNKPIRKFHIDLAAKDMNVDKELIEFDMTSSGTSGVLINNQGNKQQALIEQTLHLGLEVLNGKYESKSQKTAHNSLCLAAAIVLQQHKKISSLAEAVELAKDALSSGEAMIKFNQLVGTA